MRQVRIGLWLIAAGIWLLVASTYADEPGDVRGGIFEYSWSQGKFRWEPFLKIRHPHEGALDDTGNAMIFGFRVWNLEPPDEKGLTHPVNVIADRFIPCDGKMHKVVIKHPQEPDRQVERWLKCPPVLWNGG